jgi:hypothetical protein
LSCVATAPGITDAQCTETPTRGRDKKPRFILAPPSDRLTAVFFYAKESIMPCGKGYGKKGGMGKGKGGGKKK